MFWASILLGVHAAGAQPPTQPGAFDRRRDPRNIRTGYAIPNESYCDQPYVVVLPDGTWVCTMTTGRGTEGQVGQHVVSTTSPNRGKTWSPLVDIEPADGPEASWVTPFLTPYGRIYAFYTYNGDNVRTLPGSDKPIRADTHGWYAFKYSDDAGRSWSPRRGRIPLRLTDADRANQWHGKVQHFWGIDKPFAADGCMYFAFTKLARYFLEQGEGWIIRSDNILTEKDPAKLHFELLPEGQTGIRSPSLGSVQEEHNILPLSKGELICVYRTGGKTPAQSYSRDGGKTWSPPVRMAYGPGRRTIKTPRACPKLFMTSQGKYLFWFHNHYGESFHGRNPVFLTGGQLKKDGFIHWSQPEILLYDPDVGVRMSYPDLIEQDGHFWVTETQKLDARVHPIDRGLLEGLWNQETLKEVARDGLVLDAGADALKAGQIDMPRGLDVTHDGGLTVGVWVRLDSLKPGQVLLDCRDDSGRGIVLKTTDGAAKPAGTGKRKPEGKGQQAASDGGTNASIRLDASDGAASAGWDVDPGLLKPGKLHHVVFVLDAGPRIISVIFDGQYCDGRGIRQFGWGRYEKDLGEVSGLAKAKVSAAVKHLRIYRRALRTSQAVGNYHAGAT